MLLALLLISGLEVDTAAARADATIQEWPVPWEDSRPRDPHVDQQGRVWFVGQRGNYIAYLSPEDGSFERYEIDEGTHPHNLIIDDAGQVWYAGNRNAHIGRLDPATREITRYEMPDAAARDPHTLVLDPAGDIWFTVQGGNFIGRLATASGDVSLIAVPTERARPYGIRMGADGRAWIALFGTNKLATVDPATMVLEEVALPRPDARARRLEVTSDGDVWYVDYAGGFLGRLQPSTGEFEEWAMPGGAGARPYGTALDADERLWIAESGPNPNRIVGFDTRTRAFVESLEVPSGAGTIRHMYFHPATNEVWFGADTNTIGRARLQ